jgi:inosine/xanthosine triphosphate pyrophosphatase family protein
MNKLLIATNNKGKSIGTARSAERMGIEFVTPAQIDLELEVEEDGKNLSGKRREKSHCLRPSQRIDLPRR